MIVYQEIGKLFFKQHFLDSFLDKSFEQYRRKNHPKPLSYEKRELEDRHFGINFFKGEKNNYS